MVVKSSQSAISIDYLLSSTTTLPTVHDHLTPVPISLDPDAKRQSVSLWRFKYQTMQPHRHSQLHTGTTGSKPLTLTLLQSKGGKSQATNNPYPHTTKTAQSKVSNPATNQCPHPSSRHDKHELTNRSRRATAPDTVQGMQALACSSFRGRHVLAPMNAVRAMYISMYICLFGVGWECKGCALHPRKLSLDPKDPHITLSTWIDFVPDHHWTSPSFPAYNKPVILAGKSPVSWERLHLLCINVVIVHTSIQFSKLGTRFSLCLFYPFSPPCHSHSLSACCFCPSLASFILNISSASHMPGLMATTAKRHV